MSVWKYVFDNEYLQRADIESLKDANRRRRHRQTQSNARGGSRSWRRTSKSSLCCAARF